MQGRVSLRDFRKGKCGMYRFDFKLVKIMFGCKQEKLLNNNSLHKIEDCSLITHKVQMQVVFHRPGSSMTIKDLGSISCSIILSVLSHGPKQMFQFQPNCLYYCQHKGRRDTGGLRHTLRKLLSHLTTPGNHLILFQVYTSNEGKENAHWRGGIADIPYRKGR